MPKVGQIIEKWWNDEGKMEGFPFIVTDLSDSYISNDMFFENDSYFWEILDKEFLKEYVIKEDKVPLIIFSNGRYNFFCILPNIYAGKKIPQYFGNVIDPCLMVYRGGRHLLNVFKLKDLVELDKSLFIVPESSSKSLQTPI